MIARVRFTKQNMAFGLNTEAKGTRFFWLLHLTLVSLWQLEEY